MKPIYVDELFNRRVIICELGYSLNDDDAIDASVVAKHETEASVVAELLQEGASVNTERKKIVKTVSSNQDEYNL